MKKKSVRDKEDHHQQQQQQQELEILKAVAQAWHAHSGSCRTTNEFEANRRQFKNKPTRFKAEAKADSKSTSKNATSSDINGSNSRSMNWDFGQSLWDSYEIVTVSKRLEERLVLDDHQEVPGLIYEDSRRVFRRRTESKNSLRNLLSRISSKRFDFRVSQVDYK
ncbi:hypothetical protein Sjap_016259 [Stephania japonica]|uniref:Uncharacterized protein n=1 Tax=Stephania japonica TaxID=461633 RepID=A0AAP0IKZ8_9MAGN